MLKGYIDGIVVGMSEGSEVGIHDGEHEGLREGVYEGIVVGKSDDVLVEVVGLTVVTGLDNDGTTDGEYVNDTTDGFALGYTVGLIDGQIEGE